LNKKLKHKGIGLIQGIDFFEYDADLNAVNKITGALVRECFANGLVLERAGRADCVVKCMPPLTIEEDVMLRGLEILKKSFAKILA
jgi:diaminobutyrate-2-oxoglutarate transaminase